MSLPTIISILTEVYPGARRDEVVIVDGVGRIMTKCLMPRD